MGHNKDAPDEVGTSTTRSGEDVEDKDGKEAGRKNKPPEGGTSRPAGTSTARDSTGIDPQDPIGDEGPDVSKGGEGRN